MKQYIGYLNPIDSETISEEETLKTFKVGMPDKVVIELPNSIVLKIEKCMEFMKENRLHTITFLASTINDLERGVFKYYKNEIELISPDYMDFDKKWKVFKNDNANIIIDSFYPNSIGIELLYVNAYTEQKFSFDRITFKE